MLGLEPTGPLEGVQPGEERGQPGDSDISTVGAELDHFRTPEIIDYRWNKEQVSFVGSATHDLLLAEASR